MILVSFIYSGASSSSDLPGTNKHW